MAILSNSSLALNDNFSDKKVIQKYKYKDLAESHKQRLLNRKSGIRSVNVESPEIAKLFRKNEENGSTMALNKKRGRRNSVTSRRQSFATDRRMSFGFDRRMSMGKPLEDRRQSYFDSDRRQSVMDNDRRQSVADNDRRQSVNAGRRMSVGGGSNSSLQRKLSNGDFKRMSHSGDSNSSLNRRVVQSNFIKSAAAQNVKKNITTMSKLVMGLSKKKKVLQRDQVVYLTESVNLNYVYSNEKQKQEATKIVERFKEKGMRIDESVVKKALVMPKDVLKTNSDKKFKRNWRLIKTGNSSDNINMTGSQHGTWQIKKLRMPLLQTTMLDHFEAKEDKWAKVQPKTKTYWSTLENRKMHQRASEHTKIIRQFRAQQLLDAEPYHKANGPIELSRYLETHKPRDKTSSNGSWFPSRPLSAGSTKSTTDSFRDPAAFVGRLQVVNSELKHGLVHVPLYSPNNH